MVNWYYVYGTERVGPVDVEALKDLFVKEVINLDSYIWRKGFHNWERARDVKEIDFGTVKIEEIADKETNSPEIVFNFDWKIISDEEEVFFIKIGNDRKVQSGSKLFGPYSLNELREAIHEKRINNQSLIFSAGMPGWIKLGDTPLDPKNLKLNTNNVIEKAPLLAVVENDPLPLIALIQETGTNKCTLLGAGHFQEGKIVKCSIYSGMELKAKNLKINIEEYRSREQKVFCRIVEIDDNAKNIMLNYAD